MNAIQTTVATALGIPPGALAFSQYMFINIPLVDDCHTIASRREQLVNANLMHANQHCSQYNYDEGKQVLKVVYNPIKL